MLIDLPEQLVFAAYRRAAGAVTGAVEEMRDEGIPLSEKAFVILLTNLMAHFDGLEAQFRELLDPKLEQELARMAQALPQPDAASNPSPKPESR